MGFMSLIKWRILKRRIKQIQLNGCMATEEKVLFDGVIVDSAMLRLGCPHNMSAEFYFCRDEFGHNLWVPVLNVRHSETHNCLVWIT